MTNESALIRRFNTALRLLFAGDLARFGSALYRNGAALRTDLKTKTQSIDEDQTYSGQMASFIARKRAEQKRPPESSWWHNIYAPAAHDLGGSGFEHLGGIYSPLYDDQEVESYVHEQFIEGASHHAEYYVQHDWYRTELDRAFAGLNLDRNQPLRILDVGSGAGNTVVPLLEMFPNATLLATELSIPMLVQLKKIVERRGLEDRCSLLQLNAEQLKFSDGSFDIVCGGAILHHLFYPERTLESASRILKRGGIAVFFEPFAPGNRILHLILQLILDRNFTEASKIPEKMERYLHAYIDGLDSTWGTDKNLPRFLKIDDKWAFPKEFFLRMVKRSGFSDCHLLSLHDAERPFEKQLKVILCEYGAIEYETIPEWIWSIAADYDANLSVQQKNDLLIEASVTLTK